MKISRGVGLFALGSVVAIAVEYIAGFIPSEFLVKLIQFPILPIYYSWAYLDPDGNAVTMPTQLVLIFYVLPALVWGLIFLAIGWGWDEYKKRKKI